MLSWRFENAEYTMSPAQCLSVATRAERGFSGPWRATAPTLSLVTAHPFSSCSSQSLSLSYLILLPVHVFCLLFLLHALLNPSLSHFLSPASSPPLPTLIIPILQAHKSDTVFVFSCSFSAQGSLPVIFFTSNILSFFLYLKIKKFIW